MGYFFQAKPVCNNRNIIVCRCCTDWIEPASGDVYKAQCRSCNVLLPANYQQLKVHASCDMHMSNSCKVLSDTGVSLSQCYTLSWANPVWLNMLSNVRVKYIFYTAYYAQPKKCWRGVTSPGGAGEWRVLGCSSSASATYTAQLIM